jgi:hypothetical protein
MLLTTAWTIQGLFGVLPSLTSGRHSDADAIVAALNGFDVQGRKLRVECKKVLHTGEKEYVER